MADTSVKVTLEIAGQAADKFLEGFVAKSDAADKSLGKLKDSSRSTFGEIGVHIGKATGLYDIFVGNLAANLATKAFDALISAASGLFNTFIVDGVQAAKEQEEATHALNLALAQTGKYSEQSAKEMDDFANTLQATTGIQDDVITKNAALIQSLAGLDKDGLQRATQAAVDMSVALGMDLTAASTAVAKAANGNITAFQKMGIEIKKGNTDAETFANTLEALESSFGGRAAAQINTFGGAVALLKVQFGEVQESIGQLITNNPVVIAAIKAVADIFGSLDKAIGENQNSLALLIGEGIIKTLQAFQFLVAGADVVVRIFNVLKEVIARPFKDMGTLVGAAALVMEGKFSAAANAMREGFTESVTDIAKAATSPTGLVKVGDALADVQGKAQLAFNSMADGANKASPYINKTKTETEALTEEQKRLNAETLSWVNGLINANTLAQQERTIASDQLRMQREQDLITEQQFLMLKAEQDQAAIDAEQERLIQSVANGTITRDKYNQAIEALEVKRRAAKVKGDLAMANFEKDQNKTREQDQKDTLNNLAQLQNSKSKEMAAVGKASAIFQIGINTQEGAIKAYNALAGIPYVGPFLGAAAAAALIAYGLERSANVAGMSFQDGGIVPGSSFTGDRLSANVNSGEMILNRTQQAQLFRAANGEGTSGSSNEGILSRLERIEQAIMGDKYFTINIGEEAIFNVIRSGNASGRSFV